MQSFKITKEELVAFAQRLYQEACGGYLDLCDATTDRMVTDFLDGRELLTSGILGGAFGTTLTTSGSMQYTPSNVGIQIGLDPASSPPPTMREFSRDEITSIRASSQPYPHNLTIAGRVDDAHYQGHSLPPGGYPGTSSHEFDLAMAGGMRSDLEPERTAPSGAPLQYAEAQVHFHGETIGGNSDGIVITETPIIREEVFVRNENFVGNESERI